MKRPSAWPWYEMVKGISMSMKVASMPPWQIFIGLQ